jgi:anti-sigma factor RsiW
MTTPATQSDSRLLVHAYLDGELDPVHAIEMERRIAADPALAAERDRIAALQTAIKQQLPPEPAPEDLVTVAEYIGGIRSETARPSWQALAAAVVLAVAITGAASWFMLRPNPAETSAELVVASHVRAMMVGGRIDVVGTRPVPTLVYRHRQHLISLVAAPIAGGVSPSARQTIAGYNVLSWRDDNTAYWAVSDLGLTDLEAFAAAFRDPASDR